MSKTEQIGSLIAECLDRCRASGYTLATLINFLDQLRAGGQSEADVQRVDFIMRHILKDILIPEEAAEIDRSESPTIALGDEPTKVNRELRSGLDNDRRN